VEGKGHTAGTVSVYVVPYCHLRGAARPITFPCIILKRILRDQGFK